MPNLAKKDNCTGCTACASSCPNHCIEIIKDENGFGYPELVHATKCVACGLCEQVCPVLRDNTRNMKNPVAYAAMTQDDDLRMESSSGGVFSELAKMIFMQQGVVYGAAYEDEFQVKHICVEKWEDLWKLRGAKYAESKLGNTFNEVLIRLKLGQKVLFSGTPCQVSGLKSFLRKDYENLFCVDFVCHGVPSPMAWKEYVKYRAQKDANGEMPVAINLRSKSTGWSRYQYSNTFIYSDGVDYSCKSSESLFMNLFVGDYINRISCENCKFKGYNRVSDITLGDFWGIWDIDLEMDDDKGTSIILLHSEKAKQFWNEIKVNLKWKEVTLEQASWQNPSMLAPSKAKENREEVLSQIRQGKIGECEKLFTKDEPTFSQRVKGKVKRILRRGK